MGKGPQVCKLCQQNVEDTHPKRTFVTATDQRGHTAHTDCLQKVSWVPEIQFNPSLHVDGLRDVLTQHRANKGQTPQLVWSGMRVRVVDTARRDHRCIWCQQSCGDDGDLETICVLIGHIKRNAEWHPTAWVHRSCLEGAKARGSAVRIARNYHCFSGFRLIEGKE